MRFLMVLLLLLGIISFVVGGALLDTFAIKGYDPVAYFKVGKAFRGSQSFGFKWHKLTWYFITQENMDLFVADPQKYAPQYDGYCAWAMTEARKAQTDPEVFKIVNGKLYLNCSQASFDKWVKDIPGNIIKADANWEKLKNEN